MNVFILNTWCFYDQKSYRYFTPLKIKKKKEWYSTLDTFRPANKSYCSEFRLNLCNTMWDSYFILTPLWGSFHLEGSLKCLSHEKLDTKKRNITWRLGGHQSAGFACLAGMALAQGHNAKIKDRENGAEKMIGSHHPSWRSLSKSSLIPFQDWPLICKLHPSPSAFSQPSTPASLSESLTSCKSPSSLPSPVFFN